MQTVCPGTSDLSPGSRILSGGAMNYRQFETIDTPSYVFSGEEFRERIAWVRGILGDGIRLVFAMKANPFLTEEALREGLPLEVCSPGEEKIAKKAGAKGKDLVLSGVLKEEEEFRGIVAGYGDGAVYTAESPAQLAMLERLGREAGQTLPVLLRVTSGNQFGMDRKEAEKAVRDRAMLKGVCLKGIHYFAGTQKTLKNTLREIREMDDFLAFLSEQYGFEAELFEFGPGLYVTYFEGEDPGREEAELRSVAAALREMRFRGQIAAEMGRFLAAPCGYYITQIADCKTNRDTLYCIVDGGIHQVNYYGQMMAMKRPHLLTKEKEGETRKCMLCGALCTTADILVREAYLPEPAPGDRIVFTRCGAYSVTEGISLFLSRDMPAVYTCDGSEFRLRRKRFGTEEWNYG